MSRWRPAPDVRSISEVFLHVSGANYNLYKLVGTPPPAGFNGKDFDKSTTDKAKIASLTRQRDQAQADINLTKSRIEQMEIAAPLSGFVVFVPNYNQGPLNAKPFKVGDQVWPGAPLGEIPDLATLEMEGRIEEIDRGRITLDQQVRVRVDSLPEKNFPARLGQLSPMTLMGFEWPPTRTSG